MARWKLTEPHYLNVPTERWEHTTNDTRTGKPIRKMYRVPKHLDPRVEDDWNVRLHNMDGEIHVCYEGKDCPSNHNGVAAIVFEGDPTPGMFPLDAEATEISSRFNWSPTEGIDEESQRKSFYSKLSDTMINQLTDLKATASMQPQAHGLDKFMETMAAMMAQQTQILAALVGKTAVAPVEDELTRQARELGETKDFEEVEPLENLEPTEEEIAEATVAAQQKEAASAAKSINRLATRRI